MNHFLSMKNGKVSIDTSPLLDEITTVDDVVNSFQAQHGGCLTADLSAWIAQQLEMIDLTGMTQEESETTVFEENDFLELTVEGILGLKLHDYPELRDIQREYIDSQIN